MTGVFPTTALVNWTISVVSMRIFDRIRLACTVEATSTLRTLVNVPTNRNSLSVVKLSSREKRVVHPITTWINESHQASRDTCHLYYRSLRNRNRERVCHALSRPDSRLPNASRASPERALSRCSKAQHGSGVAVRGETRSSSHEHGRGRNTAQARQPTLGPGRPQQKDSIS